MQTETINLKPTASKSARKTPRSKPAKGDKILTLLRRPKGTSLAELAVATGWQEHSLRGFLSGTVKKRLKLEISSEKDRKGVRRYRIQDKAGS
ncbi:MAG: DUF3489 domain-containing protein [Fimbriimonadaceae bacterium]|nr:DUF3489 domain-containing protein [Alphaproteobacteria bacterium]